MANWNFFTSRSVFYFAQCVRKLHYYGAVVHSFDLLTMIKLFWWNKTHLKSVYTLSKEVDPPAERKQYRQ